MTNAMRPDRWLEFLRQEYLESFIPEGGGAIKFVVPLEEGARAQLSSALQRAAAERGFLTVHVDAETTGVHAIDRIFFRLAEQLPWRDLARRVIARLAADRSYAAALAGPGSVLEQLAAQNQLDADFLLGELRRAVAEEVFKDRRLAREFRVAMTHLCLAELVGGTEGETTFQVITDWLTGRNKAIAAVKPYQIFVRVTRANARYLLESLLVWVRQAGYPGLLLTLDIARLSLPRNPHDERLYYTRSGVLDAYEVLRQFIDGTDRLTGCLVVAVPDLTFLDDQSGRGIGAYEALKFRVFDEVHDRRLVNPLASLVRLSTLDEVTA